MVSFTDHVRKKLEGGERPLPMISFPVSLGYEAIMRARNRLFDRGIIRTKRLPVPVVSVGNLTMGGTGKTPFVIMLAGLMKERGYRPAVISRGYGGKARYETTVVSDGKKLMATVEEAGDEPLLIADSLEGVPVIAGRRRFRAGMAALSCFDVNLVILDDAFQHRFLYRDVDVVLLDGKNPFGNGYVFPGGTLRESRRGIRRAHVAVVTDGPPVGGTKEIEEETGPEIPLFMAHRRVKELFDCAAGEVLAPEMLRDKRVAAFAGIASPERFKSTLVSICGNVETFLAFPDHHAYNEKETKAILAASLSSDILVTTEKDGVRLRRYPDLYGKLKLLRIEMRLEPSPNEMMEAICGKLLKS